MDVYAYTNKNTVETVATKYDGGTGTARDPYQIRTKSQLNEFAKDVAYGDSFTDKYVELTQDIDFYDRYNGTNGSFTGVGVFPEATKLKTNSFKGNFNGNGFTVSNFLINYKTKDLQREWTDIHYGFFACLAGNATVKNLRISKSSLNLNEFNQGTRGLWFLGGIAAEIAAGSNVKIQNCEISDFNIYRSTVTTYLDVYAGGILGYTSRSSATTVKVENCKVSGFTADFHTDYDSSLDVTCVGGFAGYSSYAESYPSKAYVSCVFVPESSWVYRSTKSEIKWVDGYQQIFTEGDGYLADSVYFSKRNEFSKLEHSIEGGTYDEVGKAWYYGGSQYNSGWPALRVFIKNWITYSFSVNPSEGGRVSSDSIKIPIDANCTPSDSGATFRILNQAVTASANNGYNYYGWTHSGTSYVANFSPEIFILNFTNATGVKIGDDEISPSETGFRVYFGSPISASHSGGDGPLTLTYTFINTSNISCIVTYSIPQKYKLKSAGEISTITGYTEITPTVEIKKFAVKLKAATGSDKTTDTTWNVNYGDSVNFDSSNISFSYSDSTVIYTVNSGYEFESLSITKDDELASVSDLSNITGNILIQPIFIRWHTVTFTTIENTTLPTSEQTIKVKDGDIISYSLTNNNKTLTYNYNGSSVVYISSQHYKISNGSNDLTITDDHCKKITPVTEFWACKVIFGEIDENIGTRTGCSGEIIVEFGTSVTFSILLSNGKLVYTYEFSTGQVVNYIMAKDQYAMQYILDENGDRLSILNGLNKEENDRYVFDGPTGEDSPTDEMIRKTIYPEFGRKQYVGKLA